jgi:curved DNA-binding protein
MEFKDYYQILGVDRSADAKTISRAFRRLARQHHPDVSKTKGAEDRFKEINEAYQVLGEEARRAQYNQIYDAYKSGVPLHDLFGRAGPQGWTGPGGVTVTFGEAATAEDLLGGLGGFSDFFQQLFGFGRASGRRGRASGAPSSEWPGVEPAAAPRAEIEISLEEAFAGVRRRVALPGRTSFDVEIPRGVRFGQTIRLPGAGEAGGDVYLTVRVRPHRLFERTDDDLTIDVPITMAEAALGGQIDVPTLEGRVTMTVPPETQTGRRFRLRGLGMPHARAGGRGDLYVRARVVTPTGLSAEERRLFEELRRLRADDPRAGLTT